MRKCLEGLALGITFLCATAAAEPADPTVEAAPPQAAPRTQPPAEETDLPPEELAEQRGGATFVVNNQTLLGIVQGNVMNGDFAAGGVAFSDQALANFNGILSLAINTGLQSNIISGMAITITVRD